MATFATNKRAHFDYEILETQEAGIELLGIEVKSIRLGRAQLLGSFVIIRGGEAYITGLKIPPYQAHNTAPTYIEDRTRKILLSKKQIGKLEESLKNKGLTLIAISLYNKGPKIKIEIGLAKGKKKFDKRETIKKRETDRELRREYKR